MFITKLNIDLVYFNQLNTFLPRHGVDAMLVMLAWYMLSSLVMCLSVRPSV